MVRIAVAATDDLENGESDAGFLSDQIANGEITILEKRRTLISTAGIERAEPGPNLIRDLRRVELHVVADLGITSGPCSVGDVLNRDLSTHELLENRRNFFLGAFLPVLG